MKRIFTLTFMLLTLLTLVACGENTKSNIVSSDFSGNTYTYVINIADDITEEDEILGAAYSLSSSLYELLQDEIGSNKRYLNLTVQISGTNKISLKFVINENITKPGLNLISEKLL